MPLLPKPVWACWASYSVSVCTIVFCLIPALPHLWRLLPIQSSSVQMHCRLSWAEIPQSLYRQMSPWQQPPSLNLASQDNETLLFCQAKSSASHMFASSQWSRSRLWRGHKWQLEYERMKLWQGSHGSAWEHCCMFGATRKHITRILMWRIRIVLIHCMADLSGF